MSLRGGKKHRWDLPKDWSKVLKREQKENVVSELEKVFSDSGMIVIAEYTGLSVAEMSDLRLRMGEAGGKVRVAKNRLAKIALKGKHNHELEQFLTGQTALLFSEDPVAAAKVAREYSDENEKLRIIGGSMGSEILDASGVATVSKMPSRDELISSIIGAIVSPASNLSAAINGPGGELAGSIAGMEDKKAA